MSMNGSGQNNLHGNINIRPGGDSFHKLSFLSPILVSVVIDALTMIHIITLASYVPSCMSFNNKNNNNNNNNNTLKYLHVLEWMVCSSVTRLKYDSRFSISSLPLLFCTSSLFSAMYYRPLSGWKEVDKTGSQPGAEKHVLCECHLALEEQWAASPGIAFTLLLVDCTSTLGYILTYNKTAFIPLIWKSIGRKNHSIGYFQVFSLPISSQLDSREIVFWSLKTVIIMVIVMTIVIGRCFL